MKKQLQQQASNGFTRTLQTEFPKSVNLEKTVDLRKQLLQESQNARQAHFDQRITQSLDVPLEVIQDQKLPGVLQVKRYNFGNVFEESRPKKENIVLVQSLIRRFLAKKRVQKKRLYLQTLIEENKQFTRKNETSEGATIIQKLRQLKKAASNEPVETNPFYTAIIQILGEQNLVVQPAPNMQAPLKAPLKPKIPMNARLRPKSQDQLKVKAKPLDFKLADDGCGIMKAYYLKKYSLKPPQSTMNIQINNTYVEKQVKLEAQLDQKDAKKIKQMKAMLTKNKTEESYAQDFEEIDDEVIDEQSSIQDEVPEESIVDEDLPQSQIQDSQIQSEVKEESIYESSAIKESISKTKPKESIAEEYQEDFEEEQSAGYNDAEFDSYKSETSQIIGKQQIIIDKPISKFPSDTDFVPIVNVTPLEVPETITQKQATLEAQMLLKNYTEKYRLLRQITVEQLDELQEEHIDQKLKMRQVNQLIVSDTVKGAQIPELQNQFQLEINRLIDMNSLGTRFARIMNATLQQTPSIIDKGVLKGIMANVEQQQNMVKQVLESVLKQFQNLMDNQVILTEIKKYQSEMDQNLKWVLQKQDRIINDNLAKQLDERDQALRRFIADQFRLNYQGPKIDTRQLQDVFKKQSIASNRFDQSAKSIGQDSSFQKNASKKSLKEDSYYQPDFEEESNRMKTSKSEYEPESPQQYSDNEQLDSKRDKDAQTLVDYFTEMLIKEIQQDLFPKRDIPQDLEESISHFSSSVQQYQQTFEEESQSYSQNFEEASQSIQEPVVLAPPKLSKQEPLDDMGMKGPSFSREELSKEFDLKDKDDPVDFSIKEKPQEEEKAPAVQLIYDPRYQQFVTEILDKYSKILVQKKQLVTDKFNSVMKSYKSNKKETLGSLLNTLRFLTQKEVPEKNAFQIVDALQEQLIKLMLEAYNNQKQYQFNQIVEQAKQEILKITISRYPLDAIKVQSDFKSVYKYSHKMPLKECPIQMELQDRYIADELNKIGDEAPNLILKQILKETMQEFDNIAKQRR